MGALDVDWGVAMVAVHTRSVVSPADLAHLGVPRPRNHGDTFAGTEGLGIPKLDLGRPDSAGDVNPVVVGRPLQRFTRVDRAVHLFLLLAVVVGRLLGVFTLHPLSLTLLLGLLFVRIGDLGLLNKVVRGVFDRAEDTLVVLHSRQYFMIARKALDNTYNRQLGILVIETHVAGPFARRAVIDNAIAIPVDCHATLSA
jgi:hypothetical protein